MTVLFTALFACGTPSEAPPAPIAPIAPSEAAPAAAAVEAPAAPAVDGWSSFGAPATLTTVRPVATVFANPTPLLDQVVAVEGRVSNVCAKAGCWLVLADDQGHEMRVTMKAHGFSVPKDCSGKTARIEGVLLDKATDAATVEHYKSEAAGAAVPEEGTTSHLEIEATGVRLQLG